MPRPLLERTRENLLDWVYATAREVQHAVRPGDVTAYPTGPLAPVLLLPGVYETWEFLRPIGDRLSALGHPIHAVPGFGHNIDTIPEMSALAQAYLRDRDLHDLVIVAHSKGGLIAKHMMLTDDIGPRITRLIAINTPFAGSKYAPYALRRTLREFAPGGVTLSALAAHRDANARIVSIFSEEDLVIPGNGELEGAVNIRLPLIGHFRPLSAPLLIDRVVANLPG